MTVDTLRRDHLGAYGYERPTSPRIDAFVAGAIRFDRAYSAAPWTKPSMTSVFTALLPRDHGVTDWDLALPEDVPTLVTALHDAGYATAAVVSSFALAPEDNAFEVGFDAFDFVTEPGESSGWATAPEVAMHALDALDTLPEPFFLWVHALEPHSDYLAHPDHDFGALPIDRYDGEIAAADEALGGVLEAARRDDTIVVFHGDHGEEFLDHGNVEHTHTVYAELVRVPLAIGWPGVGARVAAPSVGLVELAPTLLAAAGVPAPEGFPEPWPLGAAGPEPAADTVVLSETRRFGDVRGVTEGGWRLVHDLETGVRGLFDLATDPNEQVDRCAEVPDRCEALGARLAAEYPEVDGG